MRASLALAGVLLASPLPAVSQPIPVPSGQAVDYVDVVRGARGERGLTWRFRFVTPAIDRVTGSMTYQDVAEDMDYLCQTFAIERLPTMGPRPNQVVISFSSAPIAFGASDPEITQFFEAYAIVDNDCIWEPF